VGSEFVPGELHEETLVTIQVGLRGFVPNAEFLPYLVVEVFEQLTTRLGHRLVDFPTEFELELVEGGLDFVRLAAALVDAGDAFLEIHAGLDGSKDLVTRAKDALEELEFFGEQLKDSLVGGVLTVEEVDHDDVVFLAVTMATTDALLDALGVPGEIVIYNEGAELKIDALSTCLSGDHDRAFLAEVVHQCGAHVGGFGAGDSVRTIVALQPASVDFLRAIVGVGAVEQDDTGGPGTLGEYAEQVALGAPRLGENDGFLRRGRRHPRHAGKANFKGLEQRFALGIGSNRRGERCEGFEICDFLPNGGPVAL